MSSANLTDEEKRLLNSSHRAAAPTRPERVSILGKSYTVGCSSEEVEALHASAKRVDQRMRQLRDNGKIVGTEQLAVIAALNIAHELIDHERRETALCQHYGNGITALQQRISEALEQLADDVSDDPTA